MTADQLYPTPVRLRLLADIAAGHCYRRLGVDLNAATCTRITGRVAEMRQAGWIELADPPHAGRYRRWQLTAAGRAVLNQSRSTP